MAHFDSEAFEFYFQRFAIDNGITQEAKNYQIFRDSMLNKFSAPKSEAEIMKEAI